MESRRNDESQQIHSTIPSSVQIVSIGDESNNFEFTFHEEKFSKILSQVPQQYKISVLSVVGAFRTGKSFLLSWILRYLKHQNTNRSNTNGNVSNRSKPWYHSFDKLDSKSGFHWRGGSKRDTTGIWMWSEPFLIEANSPGNSSEEPIALLLLDTQGMFDNDTTMKLTSSIFGLSTLFSSIQIYNVVGKIQEDHLQQLALFSEFGRVAAMKNNESTHKPFQRIKFLVRDWQHFDSDKSGPIEPLEKEMSVYLKDVLAEKRDQELQGTRDQIANCFDEISCYMLTHPGLAVTDKKYDGNTKKVDPAFLRLLDRFCKKMLSENCLEPKKFHGRALKVAEFTNYVKEYVRLFQDGENFPDATCMLKAMATANNTNAIAEALTLYGNKMSNEVGGVCTDDEPSDSTDTHDESVAYIDPSDLEEIHKSSFDSALNLYNDRANFGPDDLIAIGREVLIMEIEKQWETYKLLNESNKASVSSLA